MYKKYYIHIFATLFFLGISLSRLLLAVDSVQDTHAEQKEFRVIVQHYEDQLKTDPHNLKLILAIAEAYYNFKDYPEAIEYYKRALELDPGNVQIKLLLAESYLGNNDLIRSSTLFEELIKVEPRNPEVLGALGRIQSLHNNLIEAENYYQRALDIDPKNFSVLYYLGELRIEQRRFAQAQEIFLDLLRRDPSATWVTQALERAKQGPILESIRQLVEEGNYKKAIIRYKEQLVINPKNVELYVELGHAYMLKHDYKAAIKVYKAGLKAQPNANRLRLALGYAYIADKNFGEAQVSLERALKVGTDNAEALAGLGRIAVLKGNIPKGEEYFKQALQENSESVLTLSYLADLRLQQKQYFKAQELYQEILGIEPKASWAKQMIQELKFRPVFDAINQKLKEGRYKEVEDLYRQLIALAPDNVDNYVLFAHFYMTQKMYQKAIDIYEQVLEVDSGKIQVYIDLGYAFLYNMNLDEALKVFTYVLERNPGNSEAIAGIGLVNASLGDLDAAAYMYQWALLNNPKNEAALSFYADLLMDQKKYPEAQNIFKRIVEVDPTAIWAKQSMINAEFAPAFEEIDAMEKAGNIAGAIAKYHQLLTKSQDNPRVYYELSRLYIKLKRYNEAIEVYENGIKNNPKATELHTGLGLAYLDMGNLVEAKQNLQSAFINDPKSAEALGGLGRVAALSGDYSDAGKMYEAALRINPNDILTLSYYAEFLMQQKEYTKAQHIYERLVSLLPKAAWAQQGLLNAKNGPFLQEILSKEKTGDKHKVEALYRKLIADYPDNVDYYILLGQYYAKLKEYPEAINVFMQGLQVQPNSINLQVSLGFGYLEKGDYDVAKKVFDSVLKKDPTNAEALAGAGRLAQKQGNEPQAEKLFLYALKVDPNNITALSFYADMLFTQKKYEEAQNLYAKIMRIDPTADWVKQSLEDAKHGSLIAEIIKKDAAKDYQGEEVLWQQLLLEAPKESAYYLRFGLFYHRIKQYDKAIEIYNRGIQLAPTNPDLYAALGLVYISKKEPKKARKVFKKALKLDPMNTDALAGMGSVYTMEKQYPKAEHYITAALNVDPNNVAALSSLGDLMFKEKRYPESVEAYQKLRRLRPNEKWIKTNLENSMYAPEVDRLNALIKDEKFSEAAEGFRTLIQKAPDNPYYYFGLGLMYVRLKEFGAAIQTYLDGLKANPEENELLVSLGYAYMFNEDLGNARQALTKALERDGKEPEALAGLGEVNAKEENFDEAEHLFRLALSYDPKNQSALSFYGDLLMKKKRYTEAQEIFTWLQVILPDSPWISKAIQDAEDGPMMDLAKDYANQERFCLAAEIYKAMICAAPNDPGRYQLLGQMYINMEMWCCGIDTYLTGLMFDPDALYLWRSIAFAYIQMGEYDDARCILYYLVDRDPDDAESWAGLGRIEALDGTYCCAEVLYAAALTLSPNNITALSFLAALREDEQYNFSALEIYETLMMLDPEPKWVRVGLNTALNLTQPTLLVEGAYHVEDQWDPQVHRWSAQYEVYGARAFLNYPICDNMTLWGSAGEQFYELKDLLAKNLIYSFDVQHAAIGERWVLSPCLYLDARAGFTVYSPYRDGTFCMQHGTIAEPMLTLTYHEPTEKGVLSFASDSDLVARNFNTNVARMVGRYWIAGSYEREVVSRGWLGVEGDAYWYTDFVHNNSQRILGWFQWRPPCYSNHILFRYQFKYQTFAKNIPDYYTYKPQFINQLQVTLEKSWRVCWADSFYTSLSYGYGWQDTHTRYAQIIVILPPSGIPPYIWDRRQFNILFGNIIYDCGRLQLNLAGDFYRDTEKYTMWSVIGGIRWRF